MNDTELKNALEDLRHRAIRAHLNLDDLKLGKLIFCTSKLKSIESDIQKVSLDMLEIEDVFDENVRIPGTFNESVMRAAQLSILSSIRSSTNDAISSAKDSVSHQYSDVNFYRSLLIALIALVVSIISIFV